MGKLRELQKNARRLASDWPKIRSQALEETKEIALDLISDDQLFKKGIRGDGSKLKPYKSVAYEELKAALNPNRVTDLRLSGNFLEGLFGKVTGDDIFTDSTEAISRKLASKYGPDHISTTKANAEKYARQDVLPVLQDSVKKALKL